VGTRSASIRVAVLGCGHWGKNLVRNLRDLGVLAAVADPNPGGRERARALAPEARVYEYPEEALADPTLDAVAIATPAETHFALAWAALDAGKDVFVEKPLTTRLEDARKLVRRARHSDRIVMVGHLLEYHPAIRRIRELCVDGELGDLRYITSNRLNLGKIRTEENALWSFAPHDIAVILRLVGDLPRQVVATGGAYLSPKVADVTVTQFLFPSGVRSHIYVSWLHPFKEQRLVVIGSEKMISFCDVTKELVSWNLEVDWSAGQPVPVPHEGTPVPYPAVEPLRAECEHFVTCVAERKPPHTDALGGLAVVELLHAAQRSMDAGGAPVDVDPGALGEFRDRGPAASSRRPRARARRAPRGESLP